MRTRVYGGTELTNMSVSDLRAVVLRESRRLNRQLSRAMQKGLPLERFFSSSQMQRPSQVASTYENMTHDQLIEFYDEMQRKAKGGFTKKNLAALEQQRKRFSEETPFDEEDITVKIFDELREAEAQALSDAGMFYQTLIKVVTSGVEKSYKYFREDEDMDNLTKTKEGRQIWIEQQIERINDKIRADNKQAKRKGAQEFEELYNLNELRKASRERTQKAVISKYF